MYSRIIRNIDRPILYNATITTFNLKLFTPMSSSPIYNNHSPAPAPHLSPQPTFSTSSLLTPPPNPSSQTIPQSPPALPLLLPPLLSPLTYPLLLNDHNPSIP